MKLHEALKEREEYQWLCSKRLIEKDTGREVVVNSLTIGIGNLEPIVTFYEAERTHQNLEFVNDKALEFLKDKDCQVELLVANNSEGVMEIIPLYTFKKAYGIKEED